MKKILFLLLMSPLLVHSAELTLDECQQLARENYPLIRRYELLEQTEQLTLSNTKKGWLPQVSFNAQATYQSDVVATNIK